MDWGKWLSLCTQHLLDNIYDNCVGFWLPQYKKDSNQLEWVQWSVTEMVVNSGALAWRGEAVGAGFIQLREEWLPGVLTAACQYLWGDYPEDESWLLLAVHCGRIKDNRKLNHIRFGLCIGRNLFPMNSGGHCNKLCRDVVQRFPWRFSKPSWIKPWATMSDLRADPTCSRRLTRDLSAWTTLWFHEIKLARLTLMSVFQSLYLFLFSKNHWFIKGRP